MELSYKETKTRKKGFDSTSTFYHFKATLSISNKNQERRESHLEYKTIDRAFLTRC